MLVLADVPASFVDRPGGAGTRSRAVIAPPPLPPSGAYHFGDGRVVGLARRGDEPTLRRGLGSASPTSASFACAPMPRGHVVARDVTDEIATGPTEGLDGAGLDDKGLDDKGNAGQD